MTAARLHIDIGDAHAVDPWPQGLWDGALWDDAVGARWASTLPNWSELSCRVTHVVATPAGRDGSLGIFQPGTMTVDVFNEDGWATWATNAPTPGPTPPQPGAWIRLRADDTPLWTGRMRKVLDDYTPGAALTAQLVCVDTLGRVGVAAGPGGVVGAGDTAAQRITRCLDAVSWPPELRALDAGGPQLAAVAMEGPLLDIAQRAAVTAGGALYADTAGVIHYRGPDWLRTDPRSITAQAQITNNPIPKPPTPPPPNLVPSDNAADVEAGTTAGFVADNATLAASTVHAAHGARSLAVTQTAANPNLFVPGPMAVGAAKYQPYPGGPGAKLTLMASVWTDLPGRTFQWLWQARNAAGGFLGGAVGTPILGLTPGAWTTCRAVITLGSDPTTAGVTLWWTPRGQATGDTGYIDRMGVYAGDVPSSSWAVPSAAVPLPQPPPHVCATGMAPHGPDLDRIVNTATASGVNEATDPPTEAEVTLRDAASVVANGPASWDVSGLNTVDPAQLSLIASRALAMRAKAVPRLDQLELSPLADPGAADLVRQVAVGWRLQVGYRHPLFGWSWSFPVHVHAVSHDITPSGIDNQAAQWTCTLTLDDASVWAPGDTWDFAGWNAGRWSAPVLMDSSVTVTKPAESEGVMAWA